MKEKVKNTGLVLAALLTAAAFSMTGSIETKGSIFHRFVSEINGQSAEFLLIFIGCAFLYLKKWNVFRKSSKWITHLLAAVFAGCMLVGMSFHTLGSWAFIFSGKKQMIIAFLTFVGFGFLLDFLLSLLYGSLSTFTEKKVAEQKPPVTGWKAFMHRHPQLFAFLVILVCWLPYLVAFFPGTVSFDGWRQLCMYFGYYKFSNLHPWQMTVLMGNLMKLGSLISDNMGIFAIVLTFSIIEAACYAYVCRNLLKWKLPRWGYGAAVLFFGLVPVFGSYAQTVMKDGLFAALLACYVSMILDFCIGEHQSGKKNGEWRQWLVLFLVAAAMCMSRKNGLHMVLPSLVLTLIYLNRRQWRCVLLLVVGILAVYVGCGKISTAIGVEPGSVRAMLAIPLQQTARYVTTYPEDVTKEEKEALEAVLDYENISEIYDPLDYDYIKNSFAAKVDKLPETEQKERLSNYFKAWFSMFLRHPGVYIEATLHGTYGYFDPFHSVKVKSVYQFRTKEAIRDHFDVDYVIRSEKPRNLVKEWATLWLKLPGASQLMSPGMYTWLLLIAAGYLFYQKRGKGIFALVAPALNVAVCIASPINGLVRYAYPLLACLPAVICWCFVYGKKKNKISK